MGFVYLASPYSHPDPRERHRRYLAAVDAAGVLLSKRIWVYSPIAHNHTIAEHYDLPREFEFWRDYDLAMLAKADKLIILRELGWETSIGVQAEKEFAEINNIPVEYM